MLRSALAVGGVTLLSRVTGLLREYTHARFLGTGAGADAFRIALLIPSVLRRLVGEGAISSAFVPVFTRHIRSEDRTAVRLFAEKFLTLWTLALIAFTVLGMSLAGAGLISLSSMGAAWPAEKLELTSSLTGWLFPYLLLVGLSAAAGGILNAFGIFALPSSTPLLYNLAFIASGYLFAGLFPGDLAGYAFVIGVLCGGALQIAVLLPALWRLGIRFTPRWPGGHAGVREVMALLLPGTFGAGVYQVNVMVSSVLAMRLPGEGAVSALGYAGRLMEFVLGVFVFALSTVSLTTLSVQAADGHRADFRSTLSWVLRFTAFITIPSAAGLFILREPVISLVLKSGRFDDESAALTVQAFQWYLPGLILVGLNRALVAAFYALKDLWTPVKVGLVNLAVNGACAWALMERMGHSGVALAATAAALAQCGWLVLTFRRRERDLFSLRELGAALGRDLLAALAMAAACRGLLVALPGGEGKLALAFTVGTTVLTGGAVYLGAAHLLGAPEARGILDTVLRRARR